MGRPRRAPAQRLAISRCDRALVAACPPPVRHVRWPLNSRGWVTTRWGRRFLRTPRPRVRVLGRRAGVRQRRRATQSRAGPDDGDPEPAGLVPKPRRRNHAGAAA